METARMKRKLRDLRRLEQRFRGVGAGSRPVAGGPDLVWDEYFSTEAGARARYPLVTLCALDAGSRKRIFADYLADVLAAAAGSRGDTEAGGVAGPAGRGRRELIAALGLPPGAGDGEIRSAFRARAKELHPDLGGEAEAMAELLRLYSGASGAR